MKTKLRAAHPAAAFRQELEQIFGARHLSIVRAVVYAHCDPGPAQIGEVRSYSRYFGLPIGVWFQ
jgi:hypothetical protein